MPSGGGSNTVTEKSDPWGPSQDYWINQFGAAQAGQNNALPFFPGPTFAPFNDLQVGGQYGALDYAQNRFQPGVSYQQAMLQNMMTSPDRVADLPAVQSLMDANRSQVTDTLQRDWLPGIRTNSIASGGYGGSRQGIAEGLAMGEASKALSNANASILGNAYSGALNQQSIGAQLMPNALTMGFQGPQTAMNIGAMQQGQNQKALDYYQNRYYYPEQKFWENMNNANATYGLTQNLGQKSTSGGGNPISDIVGLGSLGLGAYNSGLFGGLGAAGAGTLMSSSMGPLLASGVGTAAPLAGGLSMAAIPVASDRRLKKNTKPIHHDGKYQWYRYEYIDPADGVGEQVGVMADEVLKVNPSAVVVRPDGMMAVKYGEL